MLDHNTKTLRELAAEANAITSSVDLKLIAEGVSQADADAVVRFHAAANPAAILAILAAQDEVVARAEALIREYGKEAGAYKAQGFALLRQVERLRLEVEALRKALSGAVDSIEEWGAYAAEYFQEKHDLAGCVAEYRALLAVIGARPDQQKPAKPLFPENAAGRVPVGAQPKSEFPAEEDANGPQGQGVNQ